MWNPVTVYILQKLNTLSSIIPTPPNEGAKKRKVLGELYSTIERQLYCVITTVSMRLHVEADRSKR
jgi:hypothetical protein